MTIARVAMRLGRPSRGGRRIQRNALFVLLSRVLSALATTTVVALAAHRLDVASFGLVASVMAAGFLANTLITFGTDTVITRAVASKDPHAPDTARRALRVQLTIATALFAIAVVSVLAGAPGVLLIEAAAMVPMAVVTVSSAVVLGAQHMRMVALASFWGSLVAVGVTVAWFQQQAHPAIPLAARAVATCVTAAILTRAARRALRARGCKPSVTTSCNEDGARIGGLLREAAPFAAMVILTAIGAQAGLLLVEFISDEPTGAYAVAVRMFEAARLVPAAAMAAAFPAMMTGFHRSRAYRSAIVALFGYSVTASGALLALADPINRLMFDSQPNGAPLIRILALALPLTVGRLALSFEAIADGRERRVLSSAIAGTAVLLIVGTLVAGRFGSTGVAWAQTGGIATALAVLAVDRCRRIAPPPAAGTSVDPGEVAVGLGEFE